jgi:putative hydroxymethylpyrimidine transport system substrate-binding protein
MTRLLPSASPPRARPRRLWPISTLVVVALVLAGCGEKSEPSGAGSSATEEFTLMLDYFPNADHAGIYAAQASGEYEKAGLDVKIQPPPDPSAPLRLLQAGRADVAISYEPELLLARDKGADLVSVGALVQKPLTSVISIGDRAISRPEQLQGKRVGTAGIPYQSAYLRTILQEAGVEPGSVREIDVGFNLTPAMLSKKVDATLGAFWNVEGVDLERRKRNPTILRMDQLGVPTYNELIFVARRDSLDEDGASRLRRFLQATARGHQLIDENAKVGVDALLEADDGLERDLQTAAVEATLPVFFPEGDRPFGFQDPEDWEAYERWMRDSGLLTRPPSERAPLTNEFLPGEGLDPGAAGLG